MTIVHSIPVDNVVYDIVVKNWGEWQIRTGHTIIRCCMSSEEQAIEEMNKILKGNTNK